MTAVATIEALPPIAERDQQPLFTDNFMATLMQATDVTLPTELHAAFRREEMLADGVTSDLGAMLSFADQGIGVHIVGSETVLAHHPRTEQWLDILQGRGLVEYVNRPPSLDDVAGLARSSKPWAMMLRYADTSSALVHHASATSLTLIRDHGIVDSYDSRWQAQLLGTRKMQASARSGAILLAVRRPQPPKASVSLQLQ